MDQLFIFTRGIFGAVLTFASGSFLAAATVVKNGQLEEATVYGMLTGILFFTWRASAYVKGVNDKLKQAKIDREKQAEAIEKLDDKVKCLDKDFAVLASRFPEKYKL